MRRTDPAASGSREALSAIYAIVARIPRGRVASYGQVARLAGLPGRARLVGRALAETPAEAGTLPWHRVINGRGQISLTGAPGREQARRLRADGITVRNGRIDLQRYGWISGSDSPLLD
jgi:methylated-DNA-protein-cysteine methyltransferase-like protein